MRPYLCESCDVYGAGDECWNCGNPFVTFGRSWARTETLPGGAARGPDFSGSLLASSGSPLVDWSTPQNDPMALYAEIHAVPDPAGA